VSLGQVRLEEGGLWQVGFGQNGSGQICRLPLCCGQLHFEQARLGQGSCGQGLLVLVEVLERRAASAIPVDPRAELMRSQAR
jgi:hypothetical protein